MSIEGMDKGLTAAQRSKNVVSMAENGDEKRLKEEKV
jgi:hypothetical protein